MQLNQIINKDCIEGMKELPDGCVDCIVTSPPYFGLRDYGTATWEGGDIDCKHVKTSNLKRHNSGGLSNNAKGRGETEYSESSIVFYPQICSCGAVRVDAQIGLEQTPELYVAKMVEVFTEVKRVLKKEGTLWLNLGDSYAASGGKQVEQTIRGGSNYVNAGQSGGDRGVKNNPSWLKPKDLIGIPWAVATALRGPFYMGKIKKESDRIWLAAMIDGEGCMFIHKRKSGTDNYSPYTKKDGTISNYSRKNDSYGTGIEVANTHRSIVDRCMAITETGSICTVERESALKNRNIPLHRWNLRNNQCLNIIKEVYPYLVGKKHEARIMLNCPSSGELAEKCHAALMLLHNGKNVELDFPPPKSLYEPGFYLRQDIIWHKLNPMPESVTDRCTKAHEYIFLLSKGSKYYYDADSIKDKCLTNDNSNRDRDNSKLNNVPGRTRMAGLKTNDYELANKRSVWAVTTKPYSEAHFATFPEDLIVDMIKAGCPEKGIVLDPFMGAGTTALVAAKLNRNYIGFELNAEYLKIAKKRLEKHLGFFNPAY